MATAAQREADRKLKEKEMRQAINQRLKESGERDKLKVKHLIRTALIQIGRQRHTHGKMFDTDCFDTNRESETSSR